MEKRTEVSGRPGVLQPFLYDLAAHPIANVILFNGGDGNLVAASGSFLMRVRMLFLKAHMNVVVPDAPSDRAGGYGPLFRTEKTHVEDNEALARFLERTSPVPIFAVGVSNGTISGVTTTAALGPTRMAGLVLASSVWLGGLSEAAVAEVAVPVLDIEDSADKCPASPVPLARQDLTRFTRAPKKDFILLTGPARQGDLCGLNSSHDFSGIARPAAAKIIAWIEARLAARTPATRSRTERPARAMSGSTAGVP